MGTIYDDITAKIIGLMETHGTEWVKPWASAIEPRNAISKRHYGGANSILLSLAAWSHGYDSAQWATFKQIKTAGGMVTKGSKSTRILFYGVSRVKDTETGQEKDIRFGKGYSVFNLDQTTGLEDRKEATAKPSEWEAHKAADQLIDDTSAAISYGGSRAFYAPSKDAICMPKRTDFFDANGFYSTIFHELGHWTGHESRLNRIEPARFGSEKYAREELVAELCAAFLCQRTGVSVEPRADHAQYLNSWIAKLKDDSREIVTAASLASKAADFIYEKHADKAVELSKAA